MSKTKTVADSIVKTPVKTVAASSILKTVKDKPEIDFAFGRINYIYMLIGVALVVLGFICMSGGKAKDPSVFNPEIFNFQRLTLAPILVIAGFIVEVYAIVKKADD